MWKTLDPVRSEHGLTILPMATLRRAVAAVRYVVSACTGALVLGAAGLLRGRRAGTHWMSRDLLRAFGAEPVAERVVVDGNIFTGRGVTAGIDVALAVAAEIASNRSLHAMFSAGAAQDVNATRPPRRNTLRASARARVGSATW